MWSSYLLGEHLGFGSVPLEGGSWVPVQQRVFLDGGHHPNQVRVHGASWVGAAPATAHLSNAHISCVGLYKKISALTVLARRYNTILLKPQPGEGVVVD